MLSPTPTQKGLLLSFDGTDSSGKETQAKMLEQKIVDLGHTCGRFATPDYTTESGKKLKALFQGVDESWDDLSWQEKMELLAANRTEHRPEVMEILSNGGVVIYDRYIPSSMAHMTVDALSEQEINSRRSEIMDFVQHHEYQENSMPKEDLSLFLDVPPQIAYQLLTSRKEKLGERDEATDAIELQTRIYQEYKWLTANNPDHFVRINCMVGQHLRSPDVIAKVVWYKIIAKFPGLDNNNI